MLQLFRQQGQQQQKDAVSVHEEQKQLIAPSPALRRVLNRHTKDTLLDFAAHWLTIYPIIREDEPIDKDDVSTHDLDDEEYLNHVVLLYERLRDKAVKKKVVDRIMNVEWMEGLTHRQVAELDIKYYQQHSELKTWKALKLGYGERAHRIKVHVDPTKIEKTLAHYLQPYFKHHVHIAHNNEMIWIRISIHDGLAANILPQSTSVLYFIWFTNSEYLVGGNIKAEWKEFVMEAFIRLFKATEIEEWPLVGKSPTSLGELLLTRTSQGAHSRFRLNQVDENPLAYQEPKKRKSMVDSPALDPLGIRHIEAEDGNRTKKRDLTIAAKFGSNPQPGLEKVEIKIDTSFSRNSKDFDLGRITQQTFPMKVVLEGTNVIEGVKNLIPLGLTTGPLPTCLSDLHSKGKSHLLME